MANAHINLSEGQDPGSFDVATDATDITSGGHQLRCIFEDGTEKSVAARLLREAALEIEHGRRAWPLAV